LFDKLKAAFSSLSKIISEKTLLEKDLDDALFELQLQLLESDIAQEAAENMIGQIKNELIGKKVMRSEDSISIVKMALHDSILEIFLRAGTVDIFERINKKSKGEPFTILFLGVNGTGKTTTIAKFANMLKKNNMSVVIAASDTHRAGAIEQLMEHANRISVKVISQRYGADPAAVARDGVIYAKTHHIDVLLIDTAGRMQTNKNLMEEMGKIVRVINPDMKIFIGDSLIGNDAISQAQLFNKYTGFDCAILTKADADAKGGAALSIAFTTGKPVILLGIGQGYDDLITFKAESFVNSLLEFN
jgi:fused signal recognition particle receptor